MAKKKKSTIEELAFPIQSIPSLSRSVKVVEKPSVMKQIILSAVKGAYNKQTPYEYSYNRSNKKQEPLVSQEQIEFVTNLIESLEPTNVIEAALASQFVIAYVRGLDFASKQVAVEKVIHLFQFSHKVIETLFSYRTKGAQFINVQYNNNQAQINNIHFVKEKVEDQLLEVNKC